jgi:hypothetical protein
MSANVDTRPSLHITSQANSLNSSKYLRYHQYSASLKSFFIMKFLLATAYLLVAAVTAVPAAQETCEQAAANCSNLFNAGCNDQIWSEYATCVTPVCGSINDIVKNAAHQKGC